MSKNLKLSGMVSQKVSFGIVGYGQFGRFLHLLLRRYLPDNVTLVFAPDGEKPVSLQDVARCDVLFLAVPISAYSDVLRSLAPLVTVSTVLVDVATVKGYTSRVISELNLPCRFVSTHPMFGPESFRKVEQSLDGFRIVITGHNLEPAVYSDACHILRHVGIKIVETSADQHDRDLAETLFLTHYVGQVVANAGFLRTEIDTVSFGYLMDAVDAVRNDGALFEQVVRYNPYCAEVIERFDRSDREIRRKMLAQSSASCIDEA